MHPTDHELLDVVDANNRVIGQATRREVHDRGLMHRSVHVFVVNHAGHLFIQQRAATKDTFPGAHDSSAAGHVNAGEDYYDTALRELEEELGLTGEVLQVGELAAMEETGWEHVRFYLHLTDRTPVPNPDEVAGGAFYSLDAAEDLITSGDGHFAPTFKILYFFYATRIAPRLIKGDLFGP